MKKLTLEVISEIHGGWSIAQHVGCATVVPLQAQALPEHLPMSDVCFRLIASAAYVQVFKS